MKLLLDPIAASVIIHVFIQDTSVTTGAGKTALAFGDITAYYVKSHGTLTAMTMETISTLGTWASTGNNYLGFKLLHDTNAPGLYELDLPDNLWTLLSLEKSLVIQLRATGSFCAPIEIQVGYPKTNEYQINGVSCSTVTTIGDHIGTTGDNVVQSADSYPIVSHADYGNAKLVRSTTPANTLSVDASHLIAVPTTQQVLLANSASHGGAAAIITLLTPITATVPDTQKVDLNTIKTNPVVNGGTVTFPTSATLASTTNITGGTIATVTNLTNLPAVPTDWLAAGGVKADAVTKIQTGLSTLAAGAKMDIVDAPNSTALNAMADAHLDRANAIETGITPRSAHKLELSSLAGKLSGAATTTVTIRNVGDTKNRITATVDADGNRSAVTTDVS
jgi:hypothetical protein